MHNAIVSRGMPVERCHAQDAAELALYHRGQQVIDERTNFDHGDVGDWKMYEAVE